jgi:hypothetical protein
VYLRRLAQRLPVYGPRLLQAADFMDQSQRHLRHCGDVFIDVGEQPSISRRQEARLELYEAMRLEQTAARLLGSIAQEIFVISA